MFVLYVFIKYLLNKHWTIQID